MFNISTARLDPLSLDASYDAVVLVSCRVSARCLEDLEDESTVLSCADSLDSGRGADRLDLNAIPSDLIPELCSLPIPRVDVRKDGVTVAELEEGEVRGLFVGLIHQKMSSALLLATSIRRDRPVKVSG